MTERSEVRTALSPSPATWWSGHVDARGMHR
jgi:hypothetical protein